MKKNVLHFSVLGLLLVIACAIPLKTADAATGSISASPQYVLIPGSVGSTTISWSTSGCGNAQVYVSVDNDHDKLMSQATSGSTNVGWIEPGKSFTFKLYADTAHTELLDTITVVGYNYNDGAVGAREKCVLIPMGQTTGTAEITWGSNGYWDAEIYVKKNNNAEQLMSGSPSGCVNPSWITPGDKFEFKLYSDRYKTTLLDSVTIYGATANSAYTTVWGNRRNFFYKYSGSASGKPLVIMLHGATGKGEEFFGPEHNAYSTNYFAKMQDYFVDNGYVVVAPSSRILLSPPTSGPTYPYADNEFDLRIRWQHEEENYYFNEDLMLIDYIKSTWASSLGINTSQVFVWGNSSGGFMASRCAQYFQTGLKGVIIVDAGDASQWDPDNDCLIEESDFLDDNNFTFSGNHSPILSITNQHHMTLAGERIIYKSVNLHYAEEMIGNVGDSTNWVIPINTASNHAWYSWGDNYYDEMLCWMTDRKDGSNQEVVGVYWTGGSSDIFSDADKWVGNSGAVAATPDQNDWVHLTGTCNIKGVANPGYLVLGWTNRYGQNQDGVVYQTKFSVVADGDNVDAPDPVCIVKEALSIGGVVGAAGHYYLYDGLLQNTGTSWDTYVGQRDYGRLIQYSGSTAVFNNLHIGDESTAYGYYLMYGGDLQTGTMRVGNGGEGDFEQNGGEVNANTYVYVGYSAGANGSKYDMNGGGFYAGNLSISSYGSMDIDISAISYFRLAGDKRTLLNGYIGNGRIYDSTSGSTIYASYNGTYTYLHN